MQLSLPMLKFKPNLNKLASNVWNKAVYNVVDNDDIKTNSGGDAVKSFKQCSLSSDVCLNNWKS